jgi:signal transduction histidine kinase
MSQAATILIIEDNPVVRFSAVRLLGAAGFAVLEAATGGEGWRLAERERPDLVLLDVMLPDANGIDLCRRMKSDPELNKLFVVLLSAIETSPESQVLGLQAGADGYIARPIENRELLARVQALLRIKQAESALRKAHDELELRVAERTTELSRANEALRALSRRLVEVQESERRFIARELHDEVGQLLTGLKLLLETSLHPDRAPEQRTIDEAIDIIQQLLDRIRHLSIDLRPQMLDDLGLVVALEWHFKRYSKQTGIEVQFQHSPFPERLPPHVETVVFRIVQEALTNVARHSGARIVKVRMHVGEETVRAQIEDRGLGFVPEDARRRGGSTGLISMKERAELIGGDLTIDSATGQGTRLTLELPFKKSADAVPLEAGSGI